jgi:hypothetical protein
MTAQAGGPDWRPRARVSGSSGQAHGDPCEPARYHRLCSAGPCADSLVLIWGGVADGRNRPLDRQVRLRAELGRHGFCYSLGGGGGAASHESFAISSAALARTSQPRSRLIVAFQRGDVALQVGGGGEPLDALLVGSVADLCQVVAHRHRGPFASPPIPGDESGCSMTRQWRTGHNQWLLGRGRHWHEALARLLICRIWLSPALIPSTAMSRSPPITTDSRPTSKPSNSSAGKHARDNTSQRPRCGDNAGPGLSHPHGWRPVGRHELRVLLDLAWCLLTVVRGVSGAMCRSRAIGAGSHQL